MATFDDFLKLEIRVGTIREARRNEKAIKPAYELVVDFGPLGLKRSSAQITDHYAPETLVGRQVAAVLNFPPKRVAGVVSEILVLGAVPQDGRVVLLAPERRIEDGAKIS